MTEQTITQSMLKLSPADDTEQLTDDEASWFTETPEQDDEPGALFCKDELAEIFAADDTPAEPAVRVSDIFSSGDKTITAFLDRAGLFANASGKRIDEALLIAALCTCVETREHLKQVLNLTPSQHLYFPKPVADKYERMFQRVESRAYDDKDRNQTDWINDNKDTARPPQFDPDARELLTMLMTNNAGDVEFSDSLLTTFRASEAHAGHFPLFAEFLAMNSKTAGERARLIRSLQDAVSADIIGQEDACKAAITTMRKVVNPGSAPAGPVFMYGASGVGKTLLATTLGKATAAAGLNYDVTIFNMEMFAQPRSECQLVGSGSQYGNAILGELTTPMEFNPNQIFVFDEIEKADESVVKTLLTILSSRLCQDATSRRWVDFSQAIFIFTSNVGQKALLGGKADHLTVDHVAALSEAFPPEFISRMSLGELVCCKPLSAGQIVQYISTLTRPAVEQLYACDDNVVRGIAMLAENLTPRSVNGAQSRLIAQVSAEVESYLLSSSDGDDNIGDELNDIRVTFSFDDQGKERGKESGAEDGTESVTAENFTSRYIHKRWTQKVTASHSAQNGVLTVHLSLQEPKVNISPRHAASPFMQICLQSSERFASVHGHSDVKATLLNAVDKLKCHEPQDGVMLYGAPGTGKTLMARALAGEAAVTFIALNAADITSGDADANVRTLFDAAQQYAPAIVFIDEFDAIAGKREQSSQAGKLLVSSLLNCLDGMTTDRAGWMLLVATNNPDSIDPALLRSGRISRHLHLKSPDKAEVETMLSEREFAAHLDAPTRHLCIKLLANENIQRVRGCLDGVEMLVNEPAEQINTGVLRFLLDEIVGEPEDVQKHPAYLKQVAWHEAGHALATHLLTEEIILVMDAVRRKQLTGFCMTEDPQRTERLCTRADIENRVKVLLAGRAAEIILHDGNEDMVSVGASDDIRKATSELKNAVVCEGLSRSGELIDGRQFEFHQHKVYDEVKAWLTDLHSEVKGLLQNNRKTLAALADALCEKQTLLSDDIEMVLNARENVVTPISPASKCG